MRRTLLFSAALIALALPAAAQSQDRFRLVIDGGAIINAESFGQDFTLTKNVESTPVTTELTRETGGFVEAGGRVRVLPSLWVGVLGFAASSKAEGTLTAGVPHPFYFNQRREVSGDLSSLDHSESGVHVEVAYAVPLGDSTEVQVFGGPSYFNVTQTVVTDFTYSDSYPYDTAQFQSATTTDASESGLGFNVGGEVTWRLSRSLQVGGLIRYSQVTVTLSPAPGNDVELRGGGLNLGAAVRVGF
jgi:Outer membrane protein beta-barrel domain